jgi:hypothetical protein
MSQRFCFAFSVVLLAAGSLAAQQPKPQLYLDDLKMEVPALSSDREVQYDYDIAYVRAPRYGDDKTTRWAEIAHPALMEPNADLMLMHPDGK